MLNFKYIVWYYFQKKKKKKFYLKFSHSREAHARPLLVYIEKDKINSQMHSAFFFKNGINLLVY